MGLKEREIITLQTCQQELDITSVNARRFKCGRRWTTAAEVASPIHHRRCVYHNKLSFATGLHKSLIADAYVVVVFYKLKHQITWISQG